MYLIRTPTNLAALGLFATGVGLLIFGNMLFYMILGEVNAKLPASQQISAFFVNYRYPEVHRLHQRFYPDSATRGRMKAIFLCGFALAGASLVWGLARAKS